MSGRARQLTARTLVVAAALVVALALVAQYARWSVISSDQFANRAAVALRDDSVRSLVAERVTDQLVLSNQADLLAARPIIEGLTSEVVGSRAFGSIFRAAVRDVHRALFKRDQNTVTLTVADVGTVLAAALEKVRPSLAKDLDSTGRVELVKRNIGDASGTLVRVADRVRLIGLVLLALAVVLVAGALAVSTSRRHTVVDLGVAVAAAGVLLIVAYGVGRAVARDQVSGADEQAAVGAVWDAFLGDLRTASWILAGAGAIVAAAAASLIRPVDAEHWVRLAFAWLVRTPKSPVLRGLRGAGLVGLGVIVLTERAAVLQLVLTVIGVALVYEGATVLLRLIYRPSPARADRPAPPAAEHASLGRRVAVGAVAVGLIGGAVALFVGGGGTTTAPAATGACNGHVELCDRHLDRVALPATHNAMSVPLPGWFSAEQEKPIADQLADGIRGLLIDTHYADKLSNGRLRTDFGSTEQLHRTAEQDGVSPEAVDAALRIRERLGFKGSGSRGMYLCHTFCELGATTLSSVLDDLHDFLVAHPNEVVVVINQDYVTPADFVAAVKRAKLDGLVYRGSTTSWPTLREMIDADQRLVFLAENHAGAAPWYRLAYDGITQETPYTFRKVALLTRPAELPASCKANRGTAGAPLFLVNHWISTDPVPRPSDATTVNAYDVLLRRVRECQQMRRHIPNLVAVNFYRRGAVFRVVDALNRVG
jgi:hypothetical protein